MTSLLATLVGGEKLWTERVICFMVRATTAAESDDWHECQQLRQELEQPSKEDQADDEPCMWLQLQPMTDLLLHGQALLSLSYSQASFPVHLLHVSFALDKMLTSVPDLALDATIGFSLVALVNETDCEVSLVNTARSEGVALTEPSSEGNFQNDSFQCNEASAFASFTVLHHLTGSTDGGYGHDLQMDLKQTPVQVRLQFVAFHDNDGDVGDSVTRIHVTHEPRLLFGVFPEDESDDKRLWHWFSLVTRSIYFLLILMLFLSFLWVKRSDMRLCAVLSERHADKQRMSEHSSVHQYDGQE